MTIACQACLGDTVVTLHEVRSLTKEWMEVIEPVLYTWELHLFDEPTGEREVLVFRTEREGVNAFAAWLLCDEPVDTLINLKQELYARMKSKKFLP